MNPDLRIALVQDALPYFSGAERVLEALLELYPQASVYSLVFNRKAFSGTILQDRAVHTSWINRLPGAARIYKALTPLLPMTVENFDLRGFDQIISISYAFAHGILADPGQLHICYKATPLRYAWHAYHDYVGQGGALRRLAVAPLLHYLRQWDFSAAQRVDFFLACSNWIGQGVWRAYHRSAEVIYPPVEIERFSPSIRRADYYVLVSRLITHKRVDLIVEAFSRLGLPLVIVGYGPQRRMLQRKAASNITFLGWQTDESIAKLLGQAKAFVYAGLEDFGIVLAEAQAAGCPVIAYGKGGAAEIVIHDQTGILYEEQCVESLMEAVGCFEQIPRRFDPNTIRLNSERFSKERFKEEFSLYMMDPQRLASAERVPG